MSEARFEVIRPITGKCIKPKGGEVSIGIGERIYRLEDGSFSVTRIETQKLFPPTVRVSEVIFTVCPFSQSSDLQEVQS